MKVEPYNSSNGHTCTMYGRLWFIVTSASRTGVLHFVDLEERPCCTCEAFYYHATRPCRHIDACLEAITHWANIPVENRQEWQERLHFLLEMGMPFLQALGSESLMSLRTSNQPVTQKRKYTLNETTKTADGQRLPARVRRKSNRLQHSKGS